MRLGGTMLIDVRNITKYFPVGHGPSGRSGGIVRALSDVSFSVDEFDSTGIVGESGSGKTTLAKIILKLITPASGEVIFNAEKIRNFRKDVQIIFQNPYNSLNPLMRIRDAVSEPLLIHHIVSRRACKDRAAELLRMVGLDAHALERRPHQFSGGQRQRICIARALACEPKVLVLDEPISSLDLTVQAQMLDLFTALKAKLRLTYLFISHNLAVVRHIADKVVVMKDGRIVEQGSVALIFDSPSRPYTQKLLESARG